MWLSTSVAGLVLGLVLGLAHGQDVSESDGGFEFIYHEYHSLLLTIHNGTCYFTTIPDSAKGLMPGDRRKLIEGKAETVITSQDQSKLFPTSLHRMQATYHDVLADFHCLDKDVYQLQLFTPKTVTCNFESSFEPFCGFTQNTDDIFDWTRWSGSTPTNGTGPDADHTRGSHATDAGHYLYIETSEPRVQNDTARLTSQVYENPDGSTHCLRFSYNMHGQQMGGMNVYVTPSTNQSPQQTPTLVWNGTGDHGEQWKDVELEIAPSGDFQVIFEGVMGSYMSDIALDDISVSREPCNPPITCDFESWLDPACGFTQDTTDTFNWTMGRGPTDTAGTGPSVDHTYGTNGTILGHYMYIETSEPRMANDIARIVKTVNGTDGASQRCLHFYYHMHGLGIGTLNVYATNLTTTSQLPPPIWSRSGVQGNYWKEAQVTIPLNSDFQLVFEGSVGPDHTSFGDIAVDDVIISDGECQGTGKDTVATAITTETTTTEPPTTTSSSYPSTATTPQTTGHHGSHTDHLTCGFGSSASQGWGWCGFTQDKTDDFDWTRTDGHGTPTEHTGPFRDNSNTANGHFLYIETSSGHRGDKARLISQEFSSSITTEHCLKFFYHTRGGTIGSLNVYVVNQTSVSQLPPPAWSLSGDQCGVWREAEVSITSRADFQIVFEGVRGDGPLGDIAIDDVYLSRGACDSPSDSPRICPSRVRLVGGTSTAGHLEIALNGQWGSVCDEGFSEMNARVVCRVLGMTHGHPGVLPSNSFSRDITNTFIFNCHGDESTIDDCPHENRYSCRHTRDVMMSCGDHCRYGQNSVMYQDGEKWTTSSTCYTKCSCDNGYHTCTYGRNHCTRIRPRDGCWAEIPLGHCCPVQRCPSG